LLLQFTIVDRFTHMQAYQGTLYSYGIRRNRIMDWPHTCCSAALSACRFGGKSSSSSSSSADDERRWRQWVDERFVKVLTANIYRTWE
jgi:hypothetical protein